ncbi:MAG: alpha/beta fold hydrolase [Planctomycetaceae bacterium]
MAVSGDIQRTGLCGPRLPVYRWGWGARLIVCLLFVLNSGRLAAQSRRNVRTDLGPTVVKDLGYGRDKKYQRLNLALPDRSAGPVPVVIWIHGGAWVTGDKDEENPAEALVSEGFAVASIEYRPATVAAYPAQLEDCQTAVNWLRSTAKKYRIDPERVGVWGQSAGGHLAAMLAVNPGGGNRAALQAVCDWSGPVDLQRLVEDSAEEYRKVSQEMLWRLYLGPAADNLKLRDSLSNSKRTQLFQSGSPMSYIAEKMPPILVVHGEQDRIVSVRQSRRFVKRLEQLGAPIDYVELPGVGHDLRESPVSAKRVVAFFRQHLDLPEPALDRTSGPWHREAEEGTLAGKARKVPQAKASEGYKVGFFDSAESSLLFEVRVAAAGPWILRVRYANGSPGGEQSTHQLTLNNAPPQELCYPHTGWDKWQTLEVQVDLQAGLNRLQFGRGTLAAELDWIELQAVPEEVAAEAPAVPESPEPESPEPESPPVDADHPGD